MPGNVLTGLVRITAPGVEQTFGKLSDGLKIVSIGAAKTGLSFDNLSQKVAFFGGGVRTFSTNLRPVVSNLNNIPPAANSAANSLNKFSQTSNSATGAMINLGRVVQDAPFGFLGIANNLNPLLESFQRLKATTGSTGSALSALGKSLTGAGGIGLALSVVSSALILFGDSLFGGSKKAETLTADLYALTSAGDAAKKSIEGLTDNLNFLKEITDITTDINFGDEFTRSSLKAQTASVALDEKIGALNDKIAELGPTADKAFTTFQQKASKSAQNKLSGFGLPSNFPEEIIGDLKEKDQKIANAVKKVFKDRVDLQEQLSKAENDRIIARAKIRENISDEDRRKQQEAIDKQKELNDKSKRDYEKYVSDTISEAKRLSNAFKNIVDLKLDLGTLDTQTQTFQKSLDFLNKFKANKFKVVIDPELKLSDQEVKDQTDLLERELAALEFDIKGIKTEPIPIEPQFSIETGFVKQEIEKKFKDLQQLFFGENSTFSKLFPSDKEFKISATPSFTLTQGALDNAANLKTMQDAAKKLSDTFNTVISQGFADAFVAVGEGLGNILSGENFGTQLFQAIGGLIENLGKALIQFGVIKKFVDDLLKNPFFKSAGAVIAVGIAAVAIGAAIKNIKGVSGARAKGGPVNAFGDYLVGEDGPEIFRPNRSGTIFSNQRSREMLAASNINTGQRIQGQDNYTGRGVSQGGITVKILGEFVQRGQDMIATIALAQQSNNRLT